MNILDFLRGRETFETRALDASTFNLGLDDEGKTASGKSVDAWKQFRLQLFMLVFH